MSNIATDTSHSPYWDDYNELKQFYKILFVPKRAVQVREMNQLQTMIQNQISSQASHQFKDGSIITGCNIFYLPNLDFVRCTVYANDNANTLFSTDALSDMLVVSRTTGLRASIKIANPGYVGTYPETNILYVDYLNTGRDSSNQEVKEFTANETFDLYDKTQDKFDELNPSLIYNTLNSLNPTTGQIVTGQAYGVFVGDGIIYQKGYFIRVLPHTILVRNYDQNIEDMLVGFETTEEIINFLQDSSLIDPADTSNRNGIGADRLKLIPTLVAKARSEIGLDDDFFPIIEFGKNNAPVKQNTDPEYAKLGDFIAKRTFETSGDFYIKPFIISTKEGDTTSKFNYTVSPGAAYVKGNRVELINAIELEADRSTALGFKNNNINTLNYGNYIICNNVMGIFRGDLFVKVDIYDQPQNSPTTVSAPNGNNIGSANIRAVLYDSGTKGTPECNYRIYITNISMNSGKSFTQNGKSLIATEANNQGNFAVGDITSTNNTVIYNSSATSLVFDTGVSGTRRLRDSNGTNDTLYTYRETASATLQTDNSATFTINSPYAGGIHRLFSTPGSISTANKARIDIAFTQNIGSYKKGQIIDLSTLPVVVLSNTQFNIDLSSIVSANQTQTLISTYPVIRSEATEIKKQLKKDTYIKIDCSNNINSTNGPFNLGLVDIFMVSNIWVGDTYSDNNPDRKNWFNIDSGQQLSLYDHGQLVVKPEFQGKLTPTSKILVKLDHFVANNVTGIGYFSVDSYPVRTPTDVANSTNISYEDIPTLSGVNLRNAVDFRPQKKNTAAIANTANNATINPNVTMNDFNISTQGTYLGEPDSNFQADIENYLSRIDLIQVSKNGEFSFKSSISSENPKTPIVDEDAMALGTAFVSPFPGITSAETGYYTGNAVIKATLAGIRGYTMNDINKLDKRIGVLEYYQALSMLEQRAKDYTVKDENGLDRFKNGIFADPLRNHTLGDISNFEYNIAIDEQLEIARPRFNKSSVDLDVNTTTNIKISGRIATLDYNVVQFISQPYASKFRAVTESVWDWTGSIALYPEYDHFQDEKTLPEVNIDIDLATPWQEFANSPFAQNYGDWRTTAVSSTSNDALVARSDNATWFNGSKSQAKRAGLPHAGWVREVTEVHETTTTTTAVSERNVQKLNVESSQTKNDLGSYVTDITLNPYMRSRNIAFIAKGLRAKTKIHAFFDGINVDQYCSPAKINELVYNKETGSATISTGQEEDVVTKTGNYGDDILTDEYGNAFGIFRIPENTFRVGDRMFRIADVDNLKTGKDGILTSAQASYTASSLTTTTRNIGISTTQPKISTTTTTETKVDTSTSITARTSKSQYDPLGQSIKITVDAGGCFMDSIGVFFRTKSEKLGVTLYLTEMIAGVPDPSRIIASSYLQPQGVSVSNDSSAETVFKFTEIPYLTNGNSYAFFLKPDGDSPDYTMWLSEVGGTDLITNEKIFSNPYVGVAFKSANSESWDVLNLEDVKFNAYRCDFKGNTGEIVFSEQNDDFLTLDGFSYLNANTYPSIQVGDEVYMEDANSNIIVGNTAPLAYLQDIDYNNDVVILDSSTGGFTANSIIRVYRPTVPGQITDDNLIAKSKILNVTDIDYSIIVPRISTTTPIGSSVGFSYMGMNNGVIDASWLNVQSETELEFVDKMRKIRSRSNKTNSDKDSFTRLTLNTNSSFISPVIDLRRRTMFAIKNMINNDLGNEETRYGNSLTKYISKPFTLAEGQDAEDIKVFVTGYRPSGTDISVYAKILASDDPDNFYDKLWTKLDMVEGASSRSSTSNVDDYREFGYSFPTTMNLPQTAFKDLTNNGIVTYMNNTGAKFVSYKVFAIKVVLTSDEIQKAPRIDDIRGIALMV